MRIELIDKFYSLNLYAKGSRLNLWIKVLMAKKLVSDYFEVRFIEYFNTDNNYIFNLINVETVKI